MDQGAAQRRRGAFGLAGRNGLADAPLVNAANVLMLLPDRDFDPTESAIPWKVLRAAGHRVSFATETAAPGRADRRTLLGEGLPFWAGTLRCRPGNRDAYEAMQQDSAFQKPARWADVDPDDFDALVMPGGHAPGMRPYLESEDVRRIVRAFFERDAPVAAVCHGVLAVARTHQREGGRSVLYGRKTTGLTNLQEKTAIGITRHALGDHYRTYPETVQDEVSALLASPDDFRTGGWLPRTGSEAKPDVGFVVRDGHYISARFPGDVHRWSVTFRDMLADR
jgi:protease I